VTWRVLAVPGHTAGHLAYYGQPPEQAPIVFCGDTLFCAGCGRLFEGTPAQMLASLDALAELPDATQVCCAHEYTLSNLRFAAAVEPDNAAIAQHAARCQAQRAQGVPTLPSTLALERQINPFLRTRQAPVIAAARARGADSSDPVAVLAALREWKNTFS
jgi:hydroxyacylglutathione hydrolase